MDAKTRGLVVGHDHRHNSEHWADLTAKIFVAKGIKVYALRGLNHTPMSVSIYMMTSLNLMFKRCS
jgi:phosphoglucomutase